MILTESIRGINKILSKTVIKPTTNVMLNKCKRNKKNKTACLRKKCVIILDEGMPIFPKFAHDMTPHKTKDL